VSRGRALLLLPVLATTPTIHAETLYVIEQLVVNVNSAPDATGTRIANIKSGDAVDVIERQGDQVHVHLANGTEGWVRKSYLSAEEPSQRRLGERTAEVEKLKQDVARLEGELAAARTGSAGKAAAPAVATPAQTPAAAETRGAENPPDPSGAEPSYFMTPPEAPARPVWHWALGSFVVALALGFVLGWQMLDRRIRRKYGGLRIY
jgi:SH3-like domain-containing protein